MSFLRKVKRNQERKEKQRFKEQLVKEGKKVQFNMKTNQLEIVEAKKPYRKGDE